MVVQADAAWREQPALSQLWEDLLQAQAQLRDLLFEVGMFVFFFCGPALKVELVVAQGAVGRLQLVQHLIEG